MRWLIAVALGTLAAGTLIVACQGAGKAPTASLCDGSLCGLCDGGECDAGVGDDGGAPLPDGGFCSCSETACTQCPAGYICNTNTACEAPGYTVNSAAQTVTSSATGLVWQQQAPTDPCPNDSPNGCTEPDAVTYCTNLQLANQTWRLPTLEELFSLVQAGQSPLEIDSTVFPSTPGQWYWTSTTSGSNGWAINFQNGEDEGSQGGSLTGIGYVRCVH